MADYVPRLTKDGIYGSPYWYSRTNPFYPTYQMPNCTCYAWGRFWECGGQDNVPNLPTGNAGTWYGQAASRGYQVGQTPALGAVACFGKSGAAGHVAVVEQISSDGSYINCSNSGYYRPVSTSNWHYFFMTTNYASNNYIPWSGYYFQGFIYNPFAGEGQPIDPSDPYPDVPSDPQSQRRSRFMRLSQKNWFKRNYW